METSTIIIIVIGFVFIAALLFYLMSDIGGEDGMMAGNVMLAAA